MQTSGRRRLQGECYGELRPCWSRHLSSRTSLPIAIGSQAVLVVDTSLKMSVGKTAAQCAHAAVGVFKHMHMNAVPWLQSWEVRCTPDVLPGAVPA